MPHQLQVVLFEPEIPQNTGTIGRLCLATETRLHLVDPLGFEISDAKLRRAGLDYWEHLDVLRHSSILEFFKFMPPHAPKVFFSKKAKKSIFEHSFKAGTFLVFGKETKGLSDDILEKFRDETVQIPLYDPRVRSLNLSNAVSIAVYEAIRQIENLSGS